jgi:hypothetical protein
MPTAEYPVVATTFRLTEHYLSGPMSRFNSWLNELQPEMFAELSYELAAERGIVHGGWMTIQTPRGRIEARAMMTRRLRPFVVEGRVVHQIGLPFHWDFRRGGRRQQRQRPDRALGRPERKHARKQGVHLPSPSRAARRRGATPDGAHSALADPRSDPGHAGQCPTRREDRTWQVEKRNYPVCRRPAIHHTGGCRNCLDA